jgi:hypothetical protein
VSETIVVVAVLLVSTKTVYRNADTRIYRNGSTCICVVGPKTTTGMAGFFDVGFPPPQYIVALRFMYWYRK